MPSSIREKKGVFSFFLSFLKEQKHVPLIQAEESTGSCKISRKEEKRSGFWPRINEILNFGSLLNVDRQSSRADQQL